MSIEAYTDINRGAAASGKQPGRPQAFIKHYAQIMSSLAQLDVSAQDVSTVRALLRPYLPGVEAHLGYLTHDHSDDMEQQRTYWNARLLRVLQTRLRLPETNVGVDHQRG